jgi:hypothetical protein
MNHKLHLLLLAVFTVPFYGIALASSSPSTFSGHITYTLNKKSNPSKDEADAYVKIQTCMDSAVWFYNTYTTLTKKITANYDTSVGTADGNSNGNIRFGKNRTYMKGCTAMHEIAHTTGVGTTTQWSKLIVNKVFTGKNATQKLREILGSQDSVLHGDGMHFWPYGINYDYEVKSKNDLINHCLIVNAIQKDLFPSPVIADESEAHGNNLSIVMNSGNVVTYTIPKSGFVIIDIYTISGKKLVHLKQGMMSEGSHPLSVNNINLSKGNYLFQLNAGKNQYSSLFSIVKNP